VGNAGSAVIGKWPDWIVCLPLRHLGNTSHVGKALRDLPSLWLHRVRSMRASGRGAGRRDCRPFTIHAQGGTSTSPSTTPDACHRDSNDWRPVHGTKAHEVMSARTVCICPMATVQSNGIAVEGDHRALRLGVTSFRSNPGRPHRKLTHAGIGWSARQMCVAVLTARPQGSRLHLPTTTPAI